MINQSLSLIHGTKVYTRETEYLNKVIEFKIDYIIIVDDVHCKLLKDNYTKIH